jgi:hypothetical protein
MSVNYDRGRGVVPVLSVVAVSRNDDHGGGMRVRMQHFVDGFIAQCKRHDLHAELVLVEWNPPLGRPALEHALRWPTELGPVRVRIVTVPREVHALYPHAAELPLLQMIGKNVGIRRARGKYVLATNVDILFNDAVMKYLRERLCPGVMLRVDRYDVPPDLPKNAPFEHVLADCDRRFRYVNGRAGTFDATSRDMVGLSNATAAQCLATLFETQMFGLGAGARRIGRLLKSMRERFRKMVRSHGVAPTLLLIAKRVLSSTRTAQFRPRRSKGSAWRSLQTVFGLLFPNSYLAGRMRSSHWLHTNACGDFTLLAREDWFRLRGYPEWPIHSWHLDSAFMYAAAAQGIREVALGPKYRIYHIDHGSGWSPNAAGDFFADLECKGIRYLSSGDLQAWHDDVWSNPARAIVNDAAWGLADKDLEQRELGEVAHEHAREPAALRGPR